MRSEHSLTNSTLTPRKSNPRCAGVEKLAQWGPNLERERNQQMIDFMHQEFQFRRHDDEERK